MKKLPLLLLFIFCFSPNLFSQNYRPFSKGSYIYRFSGTDEYYKLTVDSVAELSNGDSVFYFNNIVHALPGDTFLPDTCNSRVGRPEFKTSGDNIFGNRLVKSVNNNYLFITSTDTFTFKTNVPTGTKWLLSTRKLLKATLQQKSKETVMGETDSVVIIQINNGDIFKFSKKYGLINGAVLLRPPYSSLKEDVVPSLPLQSLILETNISAGIGTKYPARINFFDFKTGDEFGHYAEGNRPFSSITNLWLTSKIKILDVNKDSIQNKISFKYEYQYYKLSHDFVKMDTAKGIETKHETIHLNSFPFLDANSLQFTFTGSTTDYGTLLIKLNRDKFFRLELKDLFYDSCINTIGSMIDHVRGFSYTQRLGFTSYFDCCYSEDIMCYNINNGSDSSGKCPDMDKMLSINEDINTNPATLQIFPNPANKAITVKFTENSNNYNFANSIVKITDLHGKNIQFQTIKATSNISAGQELTLDVSAIANGLYLLHFISGDGKIQSSKFLISR